MNSDPRVYLDRSVRTNSTLLRLILDSYPYVNRIPYVFPVTRYNHPLRAPRDVARFCVGMGWVGQVYCGLDIWHVAENTWDQLKPLLQNDHLENLLTSQSGLRFWMDSCKKRKSLIDLKFMK